MALIVGVVGGVGYSLEYTEKRDTQGKKRRKMRLCMRECKAIKRRRICERVGGDVLSGSKKYRAPPSVGVRGRYNASVRAYEIQLGGGIGGSHRYHTVGAAKPGFQTWAGGAAGMGIEWLLGWAPVA